MNATLTVDGVMAAAFAVGGVRSRALAGHVIAADASTAGERLLRIADVICAVRHDDWLDRYPGCAVAISPRLAATRLGPVDIRGGDLVITGLFLHAWLTCGYPIELLAAGEFRKCEHVTRNALLWVAMEVR